MITIISTCKEKLSEEEFVRPLIDLLESKNLEVHVTTYKNPKINGNIVVISGTALRDFDYLNYINNFSWIKNFDGKVIGICAGARIIAKIFNLNLIKKKIIGVKEVEMKDKKLKAYFLTSFLVNENDKIETLARFRNYPVLFKIKNKKVYGFIFHPEALNPDLLLDLII